MVLTDRLKKTSSKQSKRRDLHSKYLHREINDNTRYYYYYYYYYYLPPFPLQETSWSAQFSSYYVFKFVVVVFFDFL